MAIDFSELAKRLTKEAVTPQKRTPLTPEYPYFFTASRQNIFLTLTTRRRLLNVQPCKAHPSYIRNLPGLLEFGRS